MSNSKRLDKPRRWYFTQDYTPIRVRCPICYEEKKDSRHCKIFKNLPALWSHIKRWHVNG